MISPPHNTCAGQSGSAHSLCIEQKRCYGSSYGKVRPLCWHSRSGPLCLLICPSCSQSPQPALPESVALAFSLARNGVCMLSLLLFPLAHPAITVVYQKPQFGAPFSLAPFLHHAKASLGLSEVAILSVALQLHTGMTWSKWDVGTSREQVLSGIFHCTAVNPLHPFTPSTVCVIVFTDSNDCYTYCFYSSLLLM